MKRSADAPFADPETPDGPEPHVPPVLGWSWLTPDRGLGGMDLSLELWRAWLASSSAFWTAVGIRPTPPGQDPR